MTALAEAMIAAGVTAEKKVMKPYFGGAQRNSGGAMARFANHAAHANRETASLRADHEALKDGTTQFPTRVFSADSVPRIFVSGHNSAKVGREVQKGPWAGMPLYTLTLEERATCPRSCHLWRECYGNAMPLARRVDVGGNFLKLLRAELDMMAREHPEGYVLRLHVLGDFYSAEYILLWIKALKEIPQLHAFGYTANRRGTKLGDYLDRMNEDFAGRWAIRFSVPETAEPGPMEATTIWRQPESPIVPEGNVCPVSLGASDACGTCGLCWSPAMADKRIVFIGHGMNRRGNTKDEDMPELTRPVSGNNDALLAVARAALAASPRNWDGAKDAFFARVRNDAGLLWALLEPYRLQAAQQWLARAGDTARPINPRAEIEETRGHSSCGDHAMRAPRPSAAAGAVAVSNIARLSLLDTFKVNGRPLGSVTSREANIWANYRERDARFIRVLTENLPPDEPISKYRNAAEAQKAFEAAGGVEDV